MKNPFDTAIGLLGLTIAAVGAGFAWGLPAAVLTIGAGLYLDYLRENRKG